MPVYGIIVGFCFSRNNLKNSRFVKTILELILVPDSRKRKEFGQTLNPIARSMQRSCSSLKIDDSKESTAIHILVEWEQADQMHRMLRSEEFRILSGAITALCERTEIRLNNKPVGNHISKLNSL